MSGSLQKTVAPVVGVAQQIAAPLVESAETVLDDATGQVTGAVDDIAGAVDDFAASLLDEGADLGATVGAAVDDATDEAASLVDGAINAVNDAAAPVLDAAQELVDDAGGQVTAAVDATDETASLVDDTTNAIDDAAADLGDVTDALLADDATPADDQDFSVALEGSLDNDDQVGIESEVNLDAVEEVTGDIDLAVEVSDAPAEVAATADVTAGDLAAEVDIAAEDPNESPEMLEDQPLEEALDDILSDLAAMDGAAVDHDGLLAADGDDSALSASTQVDVIGDLVSDTSILGSDAFDDAGGGEGLPEPDGVAGEGLGVLLEPQLDQGLGSGLFG